MKTMEFVTVSYEEFNGRVTEGTLPYPQVSVKVATGDGSSLSPYRMELIPVWLLRKLSSVTYLGLAEKNDASK